MADWPRKAKEGWSFADPMCGSGTFVLEACAMARDLAPGLAREQWGFSRWRGFDAGAWKTLKEEALDRRSEGRRSRLDVRGMDKDPKAIEALVHNAGILGLEGITSACQDLGAMRAGEGEHGMVVTNPPYGERLEDLDLPALYGELGNVLRRQMLGWEAWILAPMGPLSRSVGLKTSRRHPLYNGPLECRLLQFEINRTAPKPR
jgi:23S rRNA (guanine2445-N2)-methyltransferase / 23S rRNA (guanine2069-N7)-methyltransferase